MSIYYCPSCDRHKDSDYDGLEEFIDKDGDLCNICPPCKLDLEYEKGEQSNENTNRKN